MEVLVATLDADGDGPQPVAELLSETRASEAITAIALQHAAVVAPALSAYLARPDLRTRRIVPANFASAFSP